MACTIPLSLIERHPCTGRQWYDFAKIALNQSILDSGHLSKSILDEGFCSENSYVSFESIDGTPRFVSTCKILNNYFEGVGQTIEESINDLLERLKDLGLKNDVAEDVVEKD